MEIRATSVQFVRKVSGSTKPSTLNESVLTHPVDEITATVTEFLGSLIASAEPKYRETEVARARALAAKRLNKVRAVDQI